MDAAGLNPLSVSFAHRHSAEDSMVNLIPDIKCTGCRKRKVKSHYARNFDTHTYDLARFAVTVTYLLVAGALITSYHVIIPNEHEDRLVSKTILLPANKFRQTTTTLPPCLPCRDVRWTLR